MFTLLVIDNHIGDVALVKNLLAHLHRPYEVYFATDSADALDFLYLRGPYCDAPRPNLILIDLNMAGKKGRDVLECIESEPDLSSIPIIIVSASKIRKAYNAFSDNHMEKLDLDHASRQIHAIESFWIDVAELALLEHPEPKVHRTYVAAQINPFTITRF
jgi:CheY-like chemotaxis protein